ncbi:MULTISPECIES: glutathione S-transferase [Pantoea]|jgi:glutathione S-transferase|uniref:Glutathione S-transferase n=1 Tax=Pantoea brenneri TaxID=472694 RepID=A0A7Y6NIL6_9GAMM|nr:MULTISPECIES: glutathione S-transferase [Pantoea]MBZ6397712.1 glutathione S-transferase [Pantoea sp.]MBZ6440861.1 glutathione S-transferase [Pantoea sp.]NUY44276.1 glutathione S-transferase [Pantoea brenneri]NUY51776.1 glutathione S-transferase [Pantoea brenneri]NUY62101.1 glutathione S-transferase [Pantoea brenneri]
MILIGMLDSPYVRRVAIYMKVLGIQFEHRPLSVFSDFDVLAKINPTVKVPTLITDDNQVLIDSTLIINYLEKYSAHTPVPTSASEAEEQRDLRLTGFALAACEKAVQIVYEQRVRPEEKQHQPWVNRITQQLHGAWQTLDNGLRESHPDMLSVAGISIAVAWSFTDVMLPDTVSRARYPEAARFTSLAEQQTEFLTTPMKQT